MAKNTVEIPYVEGHGKAYRYRRIVPKDVRENIGKARWTKTYRKGTPLAVIEQRAKRLAAEHDSLIARGRDGENLSPEIIAEAEAQAGEWLKRDPSERFEVMSFLVADPTPSDRVFLNAMENDGRYIPDGMKLSTIYARDVERYGGSRDEKPIRYAVETFVEIVDDRDLRKITRDDVSDWINALRKRGNSSATIKRRLGALRAIANRAFLDFDYEGRNPFERHKLPEGNGAGSVDDRLPFNRAMIGRIDSYLDSSKRLNPETRNLLVLMKHTGAGPAEIGGLVLLDVVLTGKIPYVWIRPNAVRGLKTTVRKRQVPLIGDALEAAREAVKRAGTGTKGKSRDEIPVFSGFGASGRGADYLSAKLNAAIRRAGVPKSKRLTVYSFRHTMKEALRFAQIADHVQRRILGHAGHGVADNYGSSALRLSEAKEALTAAMEHLGHVEDSIYSSKERL